MTVFGLSTSALLETLEYLEDVAAIDPRKPAVDAFRERLEAEIETREFSRLEPAHPARVDPDYPPTAWKEML